MVRVEVWITLVRNDLLIEKDLSEHENFLFGARTPPPGPLISGISEQLFAQFFTALLTSMRRQQLNLEPGDVPPTPFIVPKFVRNNLGAQWDERQSLKWKKARLVFSWRILEIGRAHV